MVNYIKAILIGLACVLAGGGDVRGQSVKVDSAWARQLMAQSDSLRLYGDLETAALKSWQAARLYELALGPAHKLTLHAWNNLHYLSSDQKINHLFYLSSVKRIHQLFKQTEHFDD